MKTLYTLLALLLFVGLLSQCSSQSNEDQVSEALMKEGFNLLETNCFTCHSPKGDQDARVAPPMYAVKNHYMTADKTEDAFIADIVSYVSDPTEDKTKMPGAVKKFGVMPRMEFSEEQLTAIATYIYHTDLQEAEWYTKHYAQERQRYLVVDTAQSDAVERGKKLAMQTKAVLGKHLLSTIQAKGTAEALSFCNTRAIPLTDSMQHVLGAKIKRVSDMNRNPNNAANLDELQYILHAKRSLDQGLKIQPRIQEIDGKQVGYYPIMTNKMCLQCHGSKEDISAETLAKLNALYPEDKATGYKENQLRGIWVVEME